MSSMVVIDLWLASSNDIAQSSSIRITKPYILFHYFEDASGVEFLSSWEPGAVFRVFLGGSCVSTYVILVLVIASRVFGYMPFKMA